MIAAVASAQPPRLRGAPGGIGLANPSAIVAAELAFARLAREKGQWTAFRETADKDAIMFAPGAVNAQTWLRKRADPAEPLSWQPHRIFIACDGSYAVATGPWRDGTAEGKSGSFTTIWRQQKNGSYKWVLDFGSSTAAPANEDNIIDARVADCARRGAIEQMRDDDRRRGKRPAVVQIPNPPPANGAGQSTDGTLRWAWTGQEDGGQKLEVIMRYQGKDESVIRSVAGDRTGRTAP